MARAAARIGGITFVDLYADYPRFDIDINIEQQRLLDHDVILFQFPVFWYSTPSILKDWQDLVLEHGFAYGNNGDKLSGKHMLLAATESPGFPQCRAEHTRLSKALPYHRVMNFSFFHIHSGKLIKG